MGVGRWTEVGDRVYAGRYTFFDQNVGLILGDDAAAIVDTRISHRQARELLEDVRRISPLPIRVVVNTHGHSDHCFGNAVFREAAIWGTGACRVFIEHTGREQLASMARRIPAIAEELSEVELLPPDRTFVTSASVTVGGRLLELSFHGRAHTDNDLVVRVPDAEVLFVGDMVEVGAPPSFGDGFPLDWPAAVRSFEPLAAGPVVPGHGDVVDRRYVLDELVRHDALAAAARRAHADGRAMEAIVGEVPYPEHAAREALGRAWAQLEGSI